LIKPRRIKYLGHVAPTGNRIGAYTVVIRKPKSTNSLGRPSHVRQDNIKTYLEEI
jgi:hypothetical protein